MRLCGEQGKLNYTEELKLFNEYKKREYFGRKEETEKYELVESLVGKCDSEKRETIY